MAVYRRGNVYWAKWTAAGKLRRKSLGTRSRADAERLFAELRDREPEALRVGEILKRWVSFQEKRRKPRSVHAYRIVQRRFTGAWGSMLPSDLTRNRVEDFQEAMLEAGRAAHDQSSGGARDLGVALGTRAGIIRVSSPPLEEARCSRPLFAEVPDRLGGQPTLH